MFISLNFLFYMTSSHIVVEHIDINESPIDEVKGKNLVNISVIRFTIDDLSIL